MRRSFLTYILLLFSVWAWSQNPATDMPYECSFEEGEDLSAWVLNPNTPNATDKWMVGTAVHSEGRRSLYISTDSVNPNYGKNPNVVAAYVRYQFPASTDQEDYDISFDWIGRGDSMASRLYVMVCPEIALTMTGNYNLNTITASTSGRLSNGTQSACIPLGTAGYVCGSAQWANESFQVNVLPYYSTLPFAIVFLWVNENRTDSLNRTSIAIDNVQVNSAALKKPTNLNVVPLCDDSTMTVSWESGLREFDIEYRKVGTTAWRKESGLTDGTTGFTRVDGSKCSYVLRRILEGSYDVRVRGRDDNLRTGWVYKNLILVYCPENHCINYIDLYGANVVCTYGHHPGAQAGATPYDDVGIIDFGPDSEESRHTLHVDPTELDPRTDSLLHTVPDGALASVRLGNWRYGGEAESITYDILVDSTNQGILIVKYAVVFENPNGHPPEDEPAFKLEVLGPNGQLVDQLCGQASFTYSSATSDPSHWHMTKDGGVAWKDWTTVGLNLMPYHNQTIKVRFTTLDCGWSGHYAYAYFTVDCANAHIETENCGNDARITCKAPDGFAYEWYNGAGDVVSHDQELNVDASRQTYTCRVSFIEEPGCYFEVSTLSAPRFPVPDYTFERLYGECTSKLKFTNTSHVMNKFEGYENHTAEPCTDFHWEFRRLSTNETKVTDAQSPIYLCPQEGDSIEVKYTCYIGAENNCDSTRVDTIVVPNILSEPTEYHYTTCKESPVKFDEKWFDTDTVYVGRFTNMAGCDSTSTLYLTVYPEVKDVYIHDSICSDQNVVINGVKYNQPVEDKLIMFKTIHGCDSAVYLTLTVNQRIKAHVDTMSFVCADDNQLFLTFDITAGVYDSLGIRFNTPTLHDTMIYDQHLSSVSIPYPDTITPGVYRAELTFYQYCCGPYTQVRALEIRYSSSIVTQKWNDVLTVLSPQYNGGYEFTYFQWYMNDEPIMGANHSYLYQPLDENAEYYVALTRTDGLVMTTCPIQPVHHEQQTDFPTVVQTGQRLPIYMEHAATIWYYTMSGQLYTSFSLPQGYTSLPTPDQTGAYVIRSVNAQGETQGQVMIVE